jgi:hypothetical protein
MNQNYYPLIILLSLSPCFYPEKSGSLPGIDVVTYLSCFSAIPDKAATCTVTLFDDLPVNDNPDYIFDLRTGLTGHCFLRLRKTNGTKSAEQYIGFTASKPIAILGLPVTGKIVDNSGHKYNASLTMEISNIDFGKEIDAINLMGNNPEYSLLNFNCVSYALRVINRIRPDNPIIPVPLQGVNTGENYLLPQGLYLALARLKSQKGPDNTDIKLDVVLNAGMGRGACYYSQTPIKRVNLNN